MIFDIYKIIKTGQLTTRGIQTVDVICLIIMTTNRETKNTDQVFSKFYRTMTKNNTYFEVFLRIYFNLKWNYFIPLLVLIIIFRITISGTLFRLTRIPNSDNDPAPQHRNLQIM